MVGTNHLSTPSRSRVPTALPEPIQGLVSAVVLSVEKDPVCKKKILETATSCLEQAIDSITYSRQVRRPDAGAVFHKRKKKD
jgi:hypothetical protein